MVGPGGVDKERSDDEPERSAGNLIKSKQSNFFCKCKKIIKSKKKKQQRRKQVFSKAVACFLRGLLTDLRTKKLSNIFY